MIYLSSCIKTVTSKYLAPLKCTLQMFQWMCALWVYQLGMGTPLGLNIFGEHLGTFPLARASVWFINPCDSYYDFRMHPGDSHQGTLKNKAYYSYPGTLRATQRGWGESKGGRKAMGSAFIVVKGGVFRFTLFWWIKNIRSEMNVQEGKSRFNQAVSYLYHLGLSKKENLWLGWPGS